MRNVLAGIVAMLLTLPGCALLDPHVHAPNLLQASAEAENPQDPYAGEFAAAEREANAQRRQYLSAVSQYALLRNGTPLVAGGLGLGALLLGITDTGSADLRLGLASGAAATLGLSSLYDNRPRQLIYIGGIEAIGCAIATVTPLRMRASELARLDADLARLRSALAALPPPSGPATARLAAAAERGATALRGGENLRLAVATSGTLLRERVMLIIAAVDRQIVRTDPDPAATARLVAGFLPALDGLVPLRLLGLPAGQGRLMSGQAVVDPADAVLAAVEAVEAHLWRLRGAPQAEAALAACRLPELAGGLMVDPAGPQSLPAGGSLTLLVRGGRGDRTILVGGAFPPGSVTITRAAGAAGSALSLGSVNQPVVVTVTATREAAGREGLLLVTDGTGLEERRIPLRIEGTSPAPTQPVRSPAAQQSTVRTPGAITLSAREWSVVREAIGMPTTDFGWGQVEQTDRDDVFARSFRASILDTTQAGLNLDLVNRIFRQRRNAASLLEPNEDEIIRVVETGEAQSIRVVACRLPTVVRTPGEADKAFAARVLDADLRRMLFDAQRRLSQRPGTTDSPPISGRLDTDTLGALFRNANACRNS